MSQSPEDAATALSDAAGADSYRLAWEALSELIGQGRSFSGHEMNCAFLNTRDGSFADVSSAFALDLDDDGRAVAVCDWDFDGRQDLWLSNRTAPRVRLLRNAGVGGHWVGIGLQGTNCNRDAIGARVEVLLQGGEKRTKTVRAGDGFLAQSSKWLHFGLGEADHVQSLTVHWPGGVAEPIANVQTNAFHQVIQGAGSAVLWKPPRTIELTNSELPRPEEPEARRTWIVGRIPLPRIEGLPSDNRSAFLINLWSKSCASCVEELAGWAAYEDEIRSAGIDILALEVDGIRDGEASTPPEQFPFRSASATIEQIEVLDLFHRTFIELQRPLPVPCSFLIDSRGRVAAIYKGLLTAEQLLADASLLKSTGGEARDAAVPFPGRWASKPFPPQPLRFGEALAKAGEPNLRTRYLSDYLARFPSAEVASQLGTLQLEAGEIDAAVSTFETLFALPEPVPAAHRDAGTRLLQRDIAAPARKHLREALPSYRNDPGFRFNLGLSEAANRNANGALEQLRATVTLDPKDATAHFQIGNILQATRRAAEAIPHYRKALNLRPGWVFPANNLAWLLATNPDPELRDGEEALRLAKAVVKADGGTNSSTLSTLAAAFAESGDFASAAAAVGKALSLKPAPQQKASLEAALENYRSARPLRHD